MSERATKGAIMNKLGYVMKRALITGITGQDGSYLAELLQIMKYMA